MAEYLPTVSPGSIPSPRVSPRSIWPRVSPDIGEAPLATSLDLEGGEVGEEDEAEVPDLRGST